MNPLDNERPTMLISSMGGVGTTLLLDFCHTFEGPFGRSVAQGFGQDSPPKPGPEFLNEPRSVGQQSSVEATGRTRYNRARGLYNPLKHPMRPPVGRGIERAVFLVGDPRDSLLSLFRRENDALHYANVWALFPDEYKIGPDDAWQQTVAQFGLVATEEKHHWLDAQGRPLDCEVLEWHRANRADRKKKIEHIKAWSRRVAVTAYGGDLPGFIQRGEDQMRWQRQLAGWLDEPVPYPVLVVRYEQLWQNLSDVLEFLRIPTTAHAGFPAYRTRASSPESLSEAHQVKLAEILAPVRDRIASLAPVTWLEPGPE